ncbi:Non-classical phosphatidylinositol transfer protein (PITP) [Umbelopsis nana]
MSQNKFVQAFTADEKTAVSELKAQLPEILKSSAPATDDAPLNSLWGVPLSAESTDERIEVILVKFLRARNLDVKEAATMLTNSLIWRAKFTADHVLEEQFDEALFGPVGFMHKTDKDGRPVTYNVYGGDLDLNTVFGDVDKFIRWRVQLMEKGMTGIDFVNVDTMIQVHDYHGVSIFGSRSANSKQATKDIIKIMQDNYPEVLAKKYFINVPSWGSAIFKLVRPLLSENTVKKFVVCSSNEIEETLLKQISKENLPKQYGGESVVHIPAATENEKTKELAAQTDEPIEEDTLGVD